VRWLPLIGEYGPDSGARILLERDGGLYLAGKGGTLPLVERAAEAFALVRGGGETTGVAVRQAGGRVDALVVGDSVLPRRPLGPESGNQLVIRPVRPIDDLRREALAASPPAETGSFRAPELVELTTLDSTIHLEIRYATSNNLFGTPFYAQARAFLQRPAAEALVRVSRTLRARGYGLLVHDGYRPWYVTKMFWDATPPEKHVFVADPAKGSRHNRGCAVDLTLYDLATGAPIEMPSTYVAAALASRPAAPRDGGRALHRVRGGVVALRPCGLATLPDHERGLRALMGARALRRRGHHHDGAGRQESFSCPCRKHRGCRSSPSDSRRATGKTTRR
jgi:D-alanyl-D-alanine dipeptidase